MLLCIRLDNNAGGSFQEHLCCWEVFHEGNADEDSTTANVRFMKSLNPLLRGAEKRTWSVSCEEAVCTGYLP